MGQFDISKKKTGTTFDNENLLETVLRKSTTEVAYRQEFYKRLLSDRLVVLTTKMNAKEINENFGKEKKVNVLLLKDGRIPVFTSKGKIFDKGIIKQEVTFMEIKGKDLFTLSKGATFVLNPYSDYGKELLPNEIGDMLNGKLAVDNPAKIVTKKETKIQIGQPVNYPMGMVNALKTLFAEQPPVKNAFLGWISNPASGQPPHYIFALDVESDVQTIINEAGAVVKQFLQPNEIVDFIQVDNNGGLSDYFQKKTSPFYVR
ncbi:MAG TPA: enhanced serine sensitivity protein SseB C-terminal domain-containing protein [Bacteroidia bacterium]|nr:enhanced serine sensitivity protein SseB C-terminal domain-containing protein [Bacteroidia bacterium]